MLAEVATPVWLGLELVVVVLVALFLKRSLTATLGGMAIRIGDIDRNTNGHGKGEPTISEDVRETRAEVRAVRTAVVNLHAQSTERLDTLAATSQAHAEQLATLTAGLAALTDVVAHLGGS